MATLRPEQPQSDWHSDALSQYAPLADFNSSINQWDQMPRDVLIHPKAPNTVIHADPLPTVSTSLSRYSTYCCVIFPTKDGPILIHQAIGIRMSYVPRKL